MATVLFVDDEPRILTSMRMLFRNTYNLLFANSGHEAMEILKSQRVDVVVSDQRMPGVTGIEVLRYARETQPDAMRILLTGYSDLNAVLGSINDGEVFRFIAKPWSNEQLSDTVAKAVEAAQATAQHQNISLDAESGVGVLVIDPDPQVHAAVSAALNDSLPVYHATSIAGALDVLSQTRIGVIVTETQVDNEPIVRFLGTLKAHHPQLVSVVLTGRADANHAINLINQGQIYRLVLKPIRDGMCRMSVLGAMKQHLRLLKAPSVAQRYTVETQDFMAAVPATSAPAPSPAQAVVTEPTPPAAIPEAAPMVRPPSWLDRIRSLRMAVARR